MESIADDGPSDKILSGQTNQRIPLDVNRKTYQDLALGCPIKSPSLESGLYSNM